ncbi:MAG: pimeloyl-ACP methyl ester esterase BioH [Gallionellaceae bacterium]
MSLHIDSLGSGAPLVLIHGWAMHGGIWDNVVPQLAQQFRVHCVDLPGHGASARIAEFDLDTVVEQIAARFDEAVHVCGWSLGGQIAMRWAESRPEQIQRMVLVATTPCFVQREGWDHAMAIGVLQEFAAGLSQNYEQTLKRFLALQVRGSEQERELLADLRARMFSRGKPDIGALRGGLAILRDTDLRAILPGLNHEVMVIAGARDMLTPPAASVHLAQALGKARLVNVRGAAHVPFLSHPEIFLKGVTGFLHG